MLKYYLSTLPLVLYILYRSENRIFYDIGYNWEICQANSLNGSSIDTFLVPTE